jgi:signal transduction histidine kinase
MILQRKTLNSFYFSAIGLLGLFFLPQNISAESCGSLFYDLNNEIFLSEGWQFRKGDNLDWKEPQVEESFWVTRKIPDYGISKTENISGYHWYRCKIVLSENFLPPKKPLGIRIGKIRDIDETYFNGTLIGKTGSTVPIMEPDFHKERIYSLPTSQWVVGDNIIAIRVYAAGTQQGLKTVPEIAPEEKLIRSKFSKDAFAVGFGYIFILMGVYFLTGTFIRGLRAENSFFALFSMGIGLYTLVRSQYRYEVFDSFITSYNFELMILMPLPALFINFMIFHLEAKRNYLVLANEALLAVLFVSIPFMKTISGWNLIIQIFNYALPLSFGIVVYYIARDFKKNLPKLKFIMIGLLGLIPTIIIDSLTAIEVISVEGTIYFGFFFFLVLISVQLSEEMVSSLQKFMAMESELIRMEKIKTGFLINISNEFKEGIEKISTILSKLKSPSKKTVKADKKSLESLEALVQHTIAMIDEAVLLRKLENDEYFPEMTTFDVSPLILETIGRVEKRLDQKRKNLFVNITPKEAIIQSDKTLLSAIMRNLIENAFMYTDKSVRIDIDFQIHPGKFIFSVADEGIGMSIFEQENLFKKFVRGEKDKFIPGAGIGLSVCKYSADILNGKISVKSSEGMGSIFSLTAPQGSLK